MAEFPDWNQIPTVQNEGSKDVPNITANKTKTALQNEK